MIFRGEVASSEDDLARELRTRIKASGGVLAFSRQVGLSPAFLCHVASGRKPVSELLATKLGYRRVKTYAFIKNG